MATSSLRKFITSSELDSILSSYMTSTTFSSKLTSYTTTSNLPGVVFPNSGSGYIKFSSGHMIAWKSVTISTDVTQSWGSMYYSASKSLGNWPASFNSAPLVKCHLKGGGDGFVGSPVNVSASSAGSVYIYRPVIAKNEVTYYVSVVGFGTWK